MFNRAISPQTTNSVRVFGLAQPVSNLGPGKRAALWVSGCSLACKGCITPELQNADTGKHVSIDRIVNNIDASNSLQLDGITLTGGEPFEQAAQLYKLVKKIKRKNKKYNVLCFSGYPYSRLQMAGGDIEKLLSVIDLLVAGPFVEKQQQSDRLIASKNQELIALTLVGKQMIEKVYQSTEALPNLAISPSGQVMLVGIMNKQERKKTHQGI